MEVCLGPYEGSIILGRKELLETIKNAGYDGVSIQMGEMFGGRFIQDFDRNDWKDLRSKLRDLGLRTPTMLSRPHWPIVHPGYKELSRDLLKLYIECAVFFGADQINIWPEQPKDIEQEEGIETMRENLLKVLPEAKAANVHFSLEWEDSAVIKKYEDMLKFVEETDPELTICFDTMHLREGVDIGLAVREIGDKIGMVHFSDSERLLPGKGKVDFAAFMKAIKEINYNGSLDVVFNCSNREEIAEAREFIKGFGV